MSKPSKAEQNEERIQRLERELTEQKKKNTELQQQKTIRLNDEQLQGFLDDLTQRIEWSTNKIIDEMPKTAIIHTTEKQPEDGISTVIKWIIASLFFIVTIAIGYSLYSVWREFWNAGWINRVALFIVAFAGFSCLMLAVEIIREKDRNYIISLFSALVALVALIVTLIK